MGGPRSAGRRYGTGSKAAGAPSIPQAVKAADPKARVVALSSEKIYAADAMGGFAADYILYHQRSGPGKRALVPSAVPGHRPPEYFSSTRVCKRSFL
jgi:hypothetical protein